MGCTAISLNKMYGHLFPVARAAGFLSRGGCYERRRRKKLGHPLLFDMLCTYLCCTCRRVNSRASENVSELRKNDAYCCSRVRMEIAGGIDRVLMEISASPVVAQERQYDRGIAPSHARPALRRPGSAKRAISCRNGRMCPLRTCS